MARPRKGLQTQIKKEVKIENFETQMIDIQEIKLSENNRNIGAVRRDEEEAKVVHETSIYALAQNIKIKGLLHPICIKPIEDENFKYECVYGNRRLLAFRMLFEEKKEEGYEQFAKIPCIVREFESEEEEEAARDSENTARKNLTKEELHQKIFNKYKALVEKNEGSYRKVADMFGVSKSLVENVVKANTSDVSKIEDTQEKNKINAEVAKKNIDKLSLNFNNFNFDSFKASEKEKKVIIAQEVESAIRELTQIQNYIRDLKKQIESDADIQKAKAEEKARKAELKKQMKAEK